MQSCELIEGRHWVGATKDTSSQSRRTRTSEYREIEWLTQTALPTVEAADGRTVSERPWRRLGGGT